MKAIMEAIVPEHAVLLAGELGKNRSVTGMKIIEQASQINDVQKHEFVLIAEQANEKGMLLTELIERKSELLAGVLVNTNHDKKSVPVSVIMGFEKLHIPLISMEWQTGVGELQQFLFQGMMKSIPQEDDKRYKKFVLEQLLHDKFPPYLDYDDVFHVHHNETLHIAVIEIDDASLNELQELEQLFSSEKRTVYVTITHWHGQQQILILRRDGDGTDIYDYKRQLEALMQPFDYQYRIGLSSNSAHWENLAFSYEEAQMSIFMATQLGERAPFIAVFQDATLLKMIKSIPDTAMLETYVNETLGKLIEYDKKHGADSLEFLKTWIIYSGSTPKIAADLYLHRNTVHYRINKIKEILGYAEWNYPIICNLCFAFLVRRALRMGEQ